MKRSGWLAAAGVSTAFGIATGFAVALSTPPDKGMTPEDMQKMAEQMMALAQPSREHGVLARMAGEWKTVTTFTMMPGQPGQKAEGVSSSRMILGGRFLEVRNTGEFMGKPFEGLSIIGYDRRHEHYTVVGYDNFGTYYVAAEGVMQPDGSLLLSGSTHDPKLNHTETYDFVFRQPDDDTVVWEIWFHTPEGRNRIVHVDMKRTGPAR